MRLAVRMLIVSLLAAATSLQAITYIVPNDRDLVKRAEAIVIATAVESHSELRDGGRVVTVATLKVESVLKGQVSGDSVQLVEMGGAFGDRMMFIPGSPRYEDGKRYLVFLRTNKFGEWLTYGFGLGKFEFISDLHAQTLLMRGGTNDEMFGFEESDWSEHIERLRNASEFVTFVGTVVNGDGPAREDYAVDPSTVVFETFPEFRPRATRFVPIALATRPDYLTAGNFRWQSPSATFVYCCSPTFEPGFNGPADASSAMANWTSAGAGVSYTLGSVDNTANKGFTASDCKNAILFNDPNNEISGAAAIGGISATGTTCNPPPGSPSGPFTYMLSDGVTYNKTLEVDVVVGKSISTNEATFIGILTHELGHTLGFRHSNQTAANDPNTPCDPAQIPCTTDAVMNSVIAFNLSTLRPYDNDAVNTVYGSGPVCNAPQVTTQPASQSITSGNHANLSVVASGTPTLTYQWYVGTSGTTTSPVNGATSTTFTPSPVTTTSYWVRVSNSCNGVQNANSNTAVVTVTCAPPTAPAPIASPSSIAFGGSSTISETPTGTGPFTYQWYIGNSGVTTTPIGGATSSSVSVSPTTTTSYWVRVGGACAPTADSPATTVTVAACVPPSAPAPIASPSTIPTGQSSTLSVNASGSSPFTFQWYIGSSRDTSNPISGATSSFVTVSPTVTTNYWVRVTGQCAPFADSPATTVTVTCAPISGSPSATPNPINAGQSTTLSVATIGTGPFTYQWFNGNLGDNTSPINGATGPSTVVSPATSSFFWVHVTAPCGSQDAAVLVNVNGVCIPVAITTNPPSPTITAGSSTTLSVVVSGTAPFSFQWYTGTSGNTTNPIAGATGPSVTVTPATTITTYWVHVSNSCNTIGVNSTMAVVTLSANCTPPAITTQPLGVLAGIGTTATLKVVATGTALHYQWYKGVKGDISTKVGTDSATFTTGVSVTTSYWVRVNAHCGNSTDPITDSDTAVVTAVLTRFHAARH